MKGILSKTENCWVIKYKMDSDLIATDGGILPLTTKDVDYLNELYENHFDDIYLQPFVWDEMEVEFETIISDEHSSVLAKLILPKVGDDKINLVEVPQEQLEKERNSNYKYFSIDEPTSSQTEIEKNNMILELTKDDLIKLVKGSTPKNDMMGKYSKLEYGNYIGGFVDEWRWYEFVLEELEQEELYNIYKECKTI